MADLNINCIHEYKETWGNFCYKCGGIYTKCNETGNKIIALKLKSNSTCPEIPPIEIFKNIEKSIGYQIFFKKLKTNMNEFYKKARISCVKFIKKLIDDYKFSNKSYCFAVFYLDLIYLNYDYYSVLKDFKSELVAVGCFLVASKFH